MATARVAFHRGAPTLFINDRPAFGTVHWCPSPPAEEGEWFAAPFVRQFADAGVHLIHFCVGTRVPAPEWDAPDETGRTFYPERVLPKLRRLLDLDPEAYFILRVSIEMRPEWWGKRHPEELEVWGDGGRDTESYASTVWREQAGDFIRALIGTIRSHPEGERVIGYQPAAGGSGEWVKNSAMENRATDYSEPMRRYFRAWLGRRYDGDLNALREAWRDGRAMFNTAEAPSPEEQEGADLYHFRDPARGRKVMDFFECLADLTAEEISHFCRVIKDATDGEALAGVFYGYIMELTWSNGFFHQRLDMEHPAYQRSGHLALSKVLASPDVDYLASPYSYGFRGIGGDGPFMSLTESVRVHGKLWFNEEDTRTHKFPPNSAYGMVGTPEESVSILTRNFATALEHASAAWWADWASPGRGPYDDPSILEVLQRFIRIGEKSLACPDRSPCADLAVIIDEQSFLYERLIRTLDWPLIFRQRHWGLSRIGAPHDLYLIDDLAHLPKPYRCYLFLNAFCLSDEEREAIRRHVCKEGAVVAWMYMNGAIRPDPRFRGGLSPENMTDMIGMRIRWDMTEWSLNLLVTGYDHPITEGLPANTAWGTDERLGPIPYVDDPDAYTLGTLVSVRGNSLPGMCIKEMEEWTSLYIGAPNVPSNVLRAILGFAGGHIFSESDDVLHANRDFVSLHTVKGENKQIRLPRKADIWDLMADRPVASDTDAFSDFVGAGETKLYYYGEMPWDRLD